MATEQKYPAFAAPEAEQAVVAACLADPTALDQCAAALVDKDWFTSTELRDVWAAIGALKSADKPVDAVAVSERLAETGSSITPRRVHEIADIGTSAVYVEYYLDIARDRYRRRNMHALLAGATKRLEDTSYSAESLAAEIGVKIEAVATSTAKTEKSFAAVLDEGLAIWKMLARGEHYALQTGLPWFDGATGGLPPGSLVVIKGPPGSAKTTLVRQIAQGVCRSGNRVAVRSLEQADWQIGHAIMGDVGEVCVSAMNTPAGGSEDEHSKRQSIMARLAGVRDHICGWQFVLADGPSTIGEFRQWGYAEARRGAKLIVVDYLQRLLRDPGCGNQSDEQHVSACSTACYEIARRTGVPVLEVVSESRAGFVRYSENVMYDAWVALKIGKITDEGNLFDPFTNPCYVVTWEKARFSPSGQTEKLYWHHNRLIDSTEWGKLRAVEAARASNRQKGNDNGSEVYV